MDRRDPSTDAAHPRTSMDGAAKTPYAGMYEEESGALPLRANAADGEGGSKGAVGATPPAALPVSVGRRSRQALSFVDSSTESSFSIGAKISRRNMNQTVATQLGSRTPSFARRQPSIGVSAGNADRQINLRRTELLDVTSSLAELTVASRVSSSVLSQRIRTSPRKAFARLPSAATIPPSQGHADGTVTVYDIEVDTGAEKSHVVATPQLQAFLRTQGRGNGAKRESCDAGARVHTHVRWIAVAAESLPFIPTAQHCDAGMVLRILRHRYDLHPLALRGARRALYGDGVGHMYGHASFLDEDDTQCGLTFSYLESSLGHDPTQGPDANSASCKALFVLVLPAHDTIISFAKDHGAGNRLLSSRTLPKSASLTGANTAPAIHAIDNNIDSPSTGTDRFSALSMTTISPLSKRADGASPSRPGWHKGVLHALAGHAVLDLPDVEVALQGPSVGKEPSERKNECGTSATQKTTLQRLRPWCVAYAMLEQGIDRFRPLLAYYADFLTLFDAASTSVIKPSLVADMQAVQKGLAVFEIFVSTIHDTTTNLNEMVQHHDHYHVAEHASKMSVCDKLGRQAVPFFEDAHQQVSQLVRLVSVYQASLEGSLNAWSHWHDAMQTQVNTLLALVATVFLPLSFFTGVFGMNFQDTKRKIASMPLLNYPYGYEMFWVLAFFFAILCVYFFRRHQWFELASISLRGQYMAIIAIIILPTVIEISIYYTQGGEDV